MVVERLRARRDELVREIFARVSGDAFEHGGAHDAEYVEGLRATVAAAVEYSLQSIERGEGWVGQVPVVALAQARRAVGVGVSLDTVLRRYVVGNSLLEEFVVEEIERDGKDCIPPAQREALRGALRAQASVLDRLLVAITGEYVDELERAGRSPEQRRSERVRRLLAGETIERPELDYDLEAWHLGAIVVGKGAARAVRVLAAGVDRRCLGVAQGEQSVWVWFGGGDRFAFEDFERVLADVVGIGSHPSVVCALGEPAKGLQGWRLTHRQAQAALVVALRRSGIQSPPTRESIPFTRYGDVALLASALKDEALARALLDIYLTPLEDRRGSGPVLRETLRAYLAAECQASSAAVKLDVARSTVAKRLRSIEEKLGRTLHPCPAELEVALLLDELNVFAVPAA